MDVAPAFLALDGAKFPLAIAGGHIGLAEAPAYPGLAALRYVVGAYLGRADRLAELRERKPLQQQALGAMFIEPSDVDDLGDGVANWTALAGAAPDLADAYLVTADFERGALVVPRATLIALVEQLNALEARVASGLTLSGAPEAGPVAGGAFDALEALAAEVDELDGEARATEPPYRDAERNAAAAAKRAALYREAAALFASDDVSDAHPTLRSYVDAAHAFAAYVASPARARFLPDAPTTIADAHVALDWFRDPPATPDGVTADEWLALCERNFAGNLPSHGAGTRFVRLEGAMHQLFYRPELDDAPRLYRVERA